VSSAPLTRPEQTSSRAKLQPKLDVIEKCKLPWLISDQDHVGCPGEGLWSQKGPAFFLLIGRKPGRSFELRQARAGTMPVAPKKGQ
jgi:hypothetical protein